MKKANRKYAIETIINLAEALEACGIETKVEEKEDVIILFAEMWELQ